MRLRLASTPLATLLAAPLLVGLAPAPTAHAQTVWVVDQAAGPGADFATLGDALAAANDGDTLLVRDGDYTETIVIDDRAIDLVAEETSLVVVRGLMIRNLSAGRSVVVHGIEVAPLTIESGVGLVVEDCSGPVLLEECTFRSGEQTNPTSGTGGRWIRDSDAVTVARCIFESEAFLHVPSLIIEDSRAALFEVELVGRPGVGDILFSSGLPATPALALSGATATLSACSLTGGSGAPGFAPGPFALCQDGGDGAAALLVGGVQPSQVDLIDCLLVPGPGGLADTTSCPGTVDGAAGPRIELVNGTVNEPPGVVAPTYLLGSPLRAGAPLFFVIEGAPNSLTWVRIAFGPGPLVGHPILTGLVTTGAPDLMIPFFSSGPTGTISYQSLPGTLALPPGFDHLSFVFQHLFFEPTHGLVAGAPASLLLLDPNVY